MASVGDRASRTLAVQFRGSSRRVKDTDQELHEFPARFPSPSRYWRTTASVNSKDYTCLAALFSNGGLPQILNQLSNWQLAAARLSMNDMNA